jgi:hypothetical protein
MRSRVVPASIASVNLTTGRVLDTSEGRSAKYAAAEGNGASSGSGRRKPPLSEVRTGEWSDAAGEVSGLVSGV